MKPMIEIPIGEVIPYENNPRDNDGAVDAVAESIREFGFKQPIVVDKDKVVVVGHTRLKAAQKLGYELVPVIIADDLTEEQAKAYRLADNKTGELATWDFEMLDFEMANIEDIDMGLFGFEKEDDFADQDPEEDESLFDDIEKFEKHYGVPYQGNKSRIADIIIHLLPEGKRLVDLFGGAVQSHIAQCSPTSGILFYITT